MLNGSMENGLNYLRIELEKGNMETDRIKEALLDKALQLSVVDVPVGRVEDECSTMVLALKHKIRYDSMAAGKPFYEYQSVLDEAMGSVHEEAYRSVKMDVFLQEIIEAEHLEVSFKELETEAKASAARLDISLDMARSFYGDDYALLKNDLLKRKAVDLIFDHAILR